MAIILLACGPCVVILNCLGQVLYLDRAPRTKETLSDFREWCRVTRHPGVFRGLTGCQRTPRFWGVTFNAMQSMVYDAAGPSFNSIEIEESPNPTIQYLFDMLKALEQEVWNGNPYGHSQLFAVSRLLNIKDEHHIL